jgi:hypothetical protein
MHMQPAHRRFPGRRPSVSSRLAVGRLLIFLLAGTAVMLPIHGRSESDTSALGPARHAVVPPMAISWTTGSGKWVGYWGRRESVLCPGGGHIEGAWGTDIYTDDSSICTAAVHAGLLSTKDGGTVTIEMRPDAGQYAGSLRNGVRTGDWMEPWTGAYVFVRNGQTAEPAIAATSHMQVDSWAGQAGRVLVFFCPSQMQLQTIYGTDVYTDDSAVCSAAIHAGIISQRSGGMAAIRLLTGMASFSASTRHGVTSQRSDEWRGGSFQFVALPPNTPPPPTPETPFERAPAKPGLPGPSGTPL